MRNAGKRNQNDLGSIVKQFDAIKQQAAGLYEFAQTAMTPSRRQQRAGPAGADANYHIRDQRSLMASIQFARQLQADNPAVKAAGDRLVSNVNVGQMTPEPDTGSQTLNEHLQGKWSEYAEDKNWCDSRGLFTYEQQADKAFLRSLFDGDMFPVVDAAKPATVLNLEAHRCLSPPNAQSEFGVCGVKKTGNRVSHYFLTPKNLGFRSVAQATDVEPVPIINKDGWENVVQVFNPDFFSLDRGFTCLGAVGSTEARRDDLEYATVLRGQVASCITLVEQAIEPELIRWMIESGFHPKENSDVKPEDDPASGFPEDTDAAGFQYGTADLHPGRVLRSRLGYSLDMLSPQITGDGQIELNLLLLQYLSMCLGLPLCALMLDARMANFSTIRAIMDMARDQFQKHQRWFAGQYHRFRYRTFVRAEVKNDKMLSGYLKIEDNGRAVREVTQSRLFKHTWNHAAYRYYHPVDDAAGDVMLLAKGMMSFDQYARKRHQMSGARLGRMIVDSNAANYELALQKKIELQKKYPGIEVNEHMLFPFASMTGIHMNISRDDEPVVAGAAV